MKPSTAFWTGVLSLLYVIYTYLEFRWHFSRHPLIECLEYEHPDVVIWLIIFIIAVSILIVIIDDKKLIQKFNNWLDSFQTEEADASDK